jgi:spore germination protein GerM
VIGPRRATHLGGALVAALALGAVTGCAIRPETMPNDLSEDRVVVFGDATSGDVAAGTNRVFLLAPADGDDPQRLRSVPRAVPASPTALLESLFAGPNVQERSARLDTAIPSGVSLLGARTVGTTLTIDVTDGFDDLTPDALRLAVAQIVATATGIENVERIQLRVAGEAEVWPLGNGELTDRALTIYDFPGLVESSQPALPAIPSDR